MTTLSVVVPIFNERENISELVNRVEKTLVNLKVNYEILIIDDGSKDDSWAYIQELKKEKKQLRGIKLSRNFGHHHAITAGIHSAKGDLIVVMDGDLQDRPEVISDLFLKINEGYDAVFVTRNNRKEEFSYLIFQKIFYYILNTLSGIEFNSKQANFSIINRKVARAYKNFNESSRFYGTIIKWLGFNTTEIVSEHGSRFAGKPAYTFRKRFRLAIEIIVAFSDRPLKIAIFIGLSMSFISSFFSAWIIYSAINNGFEVLGWASLIVSIFFIGGIILVVLGLMGIYIGQIFREVKKRPIYLIDQEI